MVEAVGILVLLASTALLTLLLRGERSALLEGQLEWFEYLGLVGVSFLGPAMLAFGWGLLHASGWARWLGFGVALFLAGLTEADLIGSGDSAYVFINPADAEPVIRFGYWELGVLLIPFVLSMTILMVLDRRTTREWFARAKRIRAEYKTTRPGSRSMSRT